MQFPSELLQVLHEISSSVSFTRESGRIAGLLLNNRFKYSSHRNVLCLYMNINIYKYLDNPQFWGEKSQVESFKQWRKRGEYRLSPIHDIITGHTPLQSPSTDGSCPYVVLNLRFVVFGPRPK